MSLPIHVMSLPIHVDEYSGHTVNQRPRSFALDDQLYEIAAVLDQWYEPSAMYFKVLGPVKNGADLADSRRSQ